MKENNDTETPLQVPKQRLENLPITLFGSVMGITGLAIVYLRISHVMKAPFHGVGTGLLLVATLWFGLLLSSYLVKAMKHPEKVKEEFDHPIRVNFFPAISISLILLSIGYFELAPKASFVLWSIGASLQLAFTLRIIQLWLNKALEFKTFNPAWFIPVVGTILVPIVGASHANPEISWFFYSVGLIFWIVLFTIVLYRIIFHHPLPRKLLPTLFILIAPAAVGFVAYVKLTGTLDNFARVLFYFGLFLFMLLLIEFNRFRKLPYFVSWWAYTFPMDALTISVILFYAKTKIAFFGYLAWGLMGITTTLILYVLYQTMAAARRGEICVPE